MSLDFVGGVPRCSRGSFPLSKGKWRCDFYKPTATDPFFIVSVHFTPGAGFKTAVPYLGYFIRGSQDAWDLNTWREQPAVIANNEQPGELYWKAMFPSFLLTDPTWTSAGHLIDISFSVWLTAAT
jgi:hypothetical protein